MLITREDKHSLIDLLKSSPDEIRDNNFDIDIFNYELNEFFFELEDAIKSYKIIHASRIIDRFYLAWLNDDMFSLKLQHAMGGAINAAVGTVLMHSMAVQLASVCAIPLSTACGVTVIALSVKIYVTTPQYVAVGSLNKGIFKYSATTRRSAAGSSQRIRNR